MVTLKPATDAPPMNKKSWQAQKTIKDVETWRSWLVDSADKFIAELKELANKRGMPVEDVVNISGVREQLVEFKKQLQPLERSVHKATGRRIQRARKR